MMLRLLRLPSSLRVVQQRCSGNHIRQKSIKASAKSVEHEVEDSWNRAAGVDSATKAAPRGTLLSRKPLAKNFFVGVVDKELLAFPEVIAREEMASLQIEVQPARDYFATAVDTRAIESARAVPPSVMSRVQQLGLYGLNVPQEHGGKGWGWSSSLIASEPETNSSDIALAMLSHRVIVDLLKEVGTAQQQQRYLGKLSCGAHVATEAIYEDITTQDDIFSTKADYNRESEDWTLSGEKAFVVAGPLPADATLLFLVIAQTRRMNMKGDAALGTTFFLVDAAQPGVKLGDQEVTLGCRAVQTRRIHFDHVRLDASCMLGEPHDGNKVAEILLRSGRLRNSLLGLGMAKNLVNELAQYCLDTKQSGGVDLAETEMTQANITRATCATYAIESMIYLTAGLLDEFHEQDVALEAAITKYYTMRQLYKLATRSMDIIGPKCLISGQSSETIIRNAAQLYTHGEPMDMLRLYIALGGFQHAGTLLNDSVLKSRNPLFHPGHMLGKLLKSTSIDNPKLKMRLGDNLHPTLEPAAQFIEQSVARLHMSVELLLERYGNSVVERHSELKRIAEIASQIYAMFASASRASRSYCIGLPLADHELITAMTICSHGQNVVRTLCTETFNGPYLNNDNNMVRLGKRALQKRGYFAVHPLTFNF